MKILKLAVERFKRIEAAIIYADGKSMTLGGVNSSGKSSAIDAIITALAGPRHTCARPIHDGESNAIIGVDFDNGMKVRKKITPGGTTLEVIDGKTGEVLPKPQTLLQKLTGGMAFDISDFVHTDAKKQAQIVADLAHLDFSDGEAKTAELTDERKMLGREVKNLTGKLEGATLQKAPEEEVSVTDLLGELKEAEAANMLRSDLQEKLSIRLGRITDIENEMSCLATEKEQALDEAKNIKAGLAEGAAIDVSPIEEKIHNAGETNRKVRANAEIKELRGELEGLRKEHTMADNGIKEIARLRAKSIRDADMPIEGLSFSFDGVLFEGIPYDQCGEADRYKVAAAIGLGSIPEDGIRVLLMKTGGTLDEDNLKGIIELADAGNAQLWVEVPRETGVDVVFSEGAIKEV